jgi:hypothetical protein
MHWFDRLSRQLAAAPESQTTRRAVVKGVGAAAVAAPFVSRSAAAAAAPLASHAAAYAKNRMTARRASDTCSACLLKAYDNYAGGIQFCYDLHTKIATGGGKNRKATPVSSAGMLRCVSLIRGVLIDDLNVCRTGPACVPPAPPLPPAGSSSICAPGTTNCPGGGVTVICCFAGDACCPCGSVNGGWICCAGVIGCSCC